MKKLIFIFMILVGTLLSASTKEKITIRVGNFAPFYYKGNDGTWKGLDVELAEAVIKKAGFEVDYYELPWSRALGFLEKGEIDLVMNTSITEERGKKFNFIGPERYAQMGLIVKEENKSLDINDYDDLKIVAMKENKKFGIQVNVFYGSEFNDRLKDPEYFKYFAEAFNVDNNMSLLENDRILGFFEDKISLVYMIKNKQEFKNCVLHNFDAFPKDPVYFAVSKNMSEDKYNRLKEACEVLENDGTLEKIRKKYQ